MKVKCCLWSWWRSDPRWWSFERSKVANCQKCGSMWIPCIVLFAFKVPLPENKPFKFRRPGAINKARWMGKVIYGIKMFLLSKQVTELKDPKNLKANLMLNSRSKELDKLTHFVTFSIHIYEKWWFTCSSAIDAPVHDLSLFHQLHSYKEIHSKISRSYHYNIKSSSVVFVWRVCSNFAFQQYSLWFR